MNPYILQVLSYEIYCIYAGMVKNILGSYKIQHHPDINNPDKVYILYIIQIVIIYRHDKYKNYKHII